MRANSLGLEKTFQAEDTPSAKLWELRRLDGMSLEKLCAVLRDEQVVEALNASYRAGT